jgi:putative aldouronate transport system permease protein
MDLIIYYAGLMAVNDEYFEAADLDGANKLPKILVYIYSYNFTANRNYHHLKVGGIFRADFGMFYPCR